MVSGIIHEDGKLRHLENKLMHNQDKTECCCPPPATCTICESGFAPSKFQLVVTGIAAKSPEECTECTSLNGTFEVSFDRQSGGTCFWRNCFSVICDDEPSGSSGIEGYIMGIGWFTIPPDNFFTMVVRPVTYPATTCPTAGGFCCEFILQDGRAKPDCFDLSVTVPFDECLTCASPDFCPLCDNGCDYSGSQVVVTSL